MNGKASFQECQGLNYLFIVVIAKIEKKVTIMVTQKRTNEAPVQRN